MVITQKEKSVAKNEDIRLLLAEYNEQEGSKQKRLLMRALSAVREGNDEVAGILLSQGLDVDESGTKAQQDFLHQAASKGVPEVVKILLWKGVYDDEGNLQIATKYNTKGCKKVDA